MPEELVIGVPRKGCGIVIPAAQLAAVRPLITFRKKNRMTSSSMPERYSNVQAWAHDTFVADRALRLHHYILEYGQLSEILAEQKERSLLDVGCGGGQAAIRMMEQYPHLDLTGIDLSEWMIAGAPIRFVRTRPVEHPGRCR